METIELETSYRSKCEEHLLFLNRIRDVQPDRPTLAIFADVIGKILHLRSAWRMVLSWLLLGKRYLPG